MDFKRAASIQHMEPVKPICLEPVETQIKQVEINPSFPASFEEIQRTTSIPFQPSLIQEVSNEIQEVNSQTETLEIQAVLTRGMQAKSQQPLKPLKTPTFPDPDLTVEEVKALHKSDKNPYPYDLYLRERIQETYEIAR